jgi:glycosyltransferase involved in cell wall biosynthesis
MAARPIYRALHRLAAVSTSATVFEHNEDLAFFERHSMVGAGRSVIIRGAGIDVKGFDHAFANAQTTTQLRQALGLDDAEVVITVTRMTRQKGIPTLLEAAELVHNARPNVRFLLVGPRESEGPLAVTAAEIARHAPYVIATGPRSDIAALLKLSNVFAFPTEYREGIPRALCEAALAGLPIVTTNMPGCLEVVRDGWNGYVVPPKSPQMLAQRILDLLQNKGVAREMGARASEPVRQEFGLETIVDHCAALYGELLK